jgi:hypothetical protein
MVKYKVPILIIILTIILLVIIVATIVLNFSQPASTPAPTPTQQPEPTLPVDEEFTRPPIRYDESAQESLLEKVVNRQPLSQSDTEARNKTLEKLPAGVRGGVLYQSVNIIIDYTSDIDIFQVEILTPNIDQAKTEAVTWFQAQGLSQDAVCNYPVQFYLNFDLAQQLRGKDIVFTPLAPGCK